MRATCSGGNRGGRPGNNERRTLLSAACAPQCKMEKKMPLETRSVSRQMIYLVLSLIGLIAVLNLLTYWQL